MLWGALALLTLAVARVTRLITADQILLPLRRWVVNKFGEDSQITYLAHCQWCASIWVAFPAALLWAVVMLPLHQWWLAIPAWLTMAYITGLLSQLEER
jgi:hypothetical protein